MLPALAALLLPLMLSVGCASLPGSGFDSPQVELLSLRPITGLGMEARFAVSLRIVNPNAVPIAIEGLAYEVDLRGSRVLSGVSNRPLTVEPFSEAVTELEVAAGMLGSIGLLRDLIVDPPSGEIPYRLRTKLALGSGLKRSLRVTHEGTISFGSPRGRGA
jgi:LEA14-like dessication related protein